MRAASWETSAGALAAFLNATTQAYMVDLFTLTLSGGSVIRYTSADVAVTVNSLTYAAGPVITRGNTKLAVGIAVDSLDVTFAADTSVTINSVPLLQFIASGGLDGARLALDRAFASAPGAAWVGMLPLFQGRVSDTSISRYEASLTINSDSELLNVMVPRNVYQPGCGNTLFDAACAVSKAGSAATATATSATDATKTTFGTGLAQADSYFSLGFAVGVTGANAGVGRTIKAFANGVIQTIQPWPQAVAVGNTFTVYPGCDKTQATCQSKFANLARFRGHPYIPAPESIT
jgi:uncharacterized phage protein (TIGR02218 family)